MRLDDAKATVAHLLFGEEKVADLLNRLAELERERAIALRVQLELAGRLQAVRRRPMVSAAEFTALDAQLQAASEQVSTLAQTLDHLRMVAGALQLPLHLVPQLEIVEATELVPEGALPILEQLRRAKDRRWQAQVATWRAEDDFEAGRVDRQILDAARVACAAAAAAFDASMQVAKALGFDTMQAHVDPSGALSLRMPTKDEWRAHEAAKEPSP